MTDKLDVEMQWVVYRVQDFTIMNMYYLEEDAKKKCRRRNNQTAYFGQPPYGKKRFAVDNLHGMTRQQWQVWKRLGAAHE